VSQEQQAPARATAKRADPKKGRPAGQPAEGAANNSRPQDPGGQWQCKTETLLYLEQRFALCGHYLFLQSSLPYMESTLASLEGSL